MSKPQVLRAVNNGTQTSPGSGNVTGTQKKNPSAITSIGTSSKTASQNTQPKKIPRKSSKPIITWFQRKLAGTVKGKRTEALTVGFSELGLGAPQSAGRVSGRTSSSPLPPSSGTKRFAKRNSTTNTHRTTVSLTDEDAREYAQSFHDDDDSIGRSSYARDSLWSPQSALEADDDASVRPIPPSAPPSPSPSRSSSSVLSDPRTFRSIAASTKPTTVLSIELGNGMAHIAQVPPNATSNPVHRIAPHIRHSSSLSSPSHLNSGNSITFSSLPTSPPQSSQPPSVRNFGSISSLNFGSAVQYSSGVGHVQAPLHTSHHPRNNPRPSSPPLDNASMLTLASSAYALPARNSGTHAYSITTSALGDNTSQYNGSMLFPDGESTSQFLLGDDDRLDDRDIDASVRALRPRSSRRGSWESEASRWSARVHAGGGTPSLARERSLWTTNSIRTGAFSAEINGEFIDQSKDGDDDELDGGKGGSYEDESPLDVQEDGVQLETPATKNIELKGERDEPNERPTADEASRKPLHRPSVETIGSPALSNGTDHSPLSNPPQLPKLDKEENSSA
ncbi:hypothetical protein CC1G_00470 [Coprinopsis cinerea okayama7|uniref:Uncharacterized protein n=1 Tax=Coprinopsis cinerea (strain Okayama-7 / 130 / ATCC MYA-4618 / FGSC 9003) TaxID=240176 RepID=A8NY19_COPC7|nr:hypothetical protein CC1G_00470 [Coprinopsis cinerea okayama7\|eukprot:XP_001837334.1 hypothetical protein CC1G_00470 [Coprinopsis cinerea okayama7\